MPRPRLRVAGRPFDSSPFKTRAKELPASHRKTGEGGQKFGAFNRQPASNRFPHKARKSRKPKGTPCKGNEGGRL